MEGHITHDGTAIVCREKGWPLTDLSLKERSVVLGKPTASSMMAGHGSDPGVGRQCLALAVMCDRS